MLKTKSIGLYNETICIHPAAAVFKRPLLHWLSLIGVTSYGTLQGRTPPELATEGSDGLLVNTTHFSVLATGSQSLKLA